MISMVWDVTVRKQAELELQERNRQLAALARASGELNAVLDLSQVLRTLVAAALELTGATAGTAARMIDGQLVFREYNRAGQLTAIDDRFDPGHGVPGHVLQTREPYLANDAGSDPHVIPEIRQQRGFVNLLDVPIRNALGEVLGCVELHNKPGGFDPDDVVLLKGLAANAAVAIENAVLFEERQRAEEAVLAANSLLEERVAERTAQLTAVNAELESFSYAVSHDLKAPLRGVDGYSRLLAEAAASKLDDEERAFLQNIRQGVAQMHALIESLLAYSRMERRALQPIPLDLGELVERALAEYATDLERFGTQVEVRLPQLLLHADHDGMAMVLRNLLGNALKFSRTAAPPKITVGAKAEGGRVLLWVQDNGIGFAMKFHDRIFEMFSRLERVENYAGTGVGLALVRKAVKRMGGKIWAQSAPGQGATFFVELPQ